MESMLLGLNIVKCRFKILASNKNLFFSFISRLTTLEDLELIFRDASGVVEIPKGLIPETVKILLLILHSDIREIDTQKVLEYGSIPSMVENLGITHQLFKHDIGLIPESVHTMVVHCCETESLVVPPKVKNLHISYDGYFSLKCTIPSSVKELKIGNHYSNCINFPTTNLIPSSVKDLKLLVNFNKPLEMGVIPIGVDSLELNQRFDQRILPGALPEGIKKLKIGYYFGRSLELNEWYLPSTVTSLELQGFKVPVLRQGINLPSTLRHLITNEDQSPETWIPPFLESLVCRFKCISVGLIPSSLKSIVFTSDIMNIEIGSLSNSLTKIYFSKMIDHSVKLIDGVFPTSLLKLRLSVPNTMEPLPVIPNSVIKLDFNVIVHENSSKLVPLELLIPKSVNHLILSGSNFSFDRFQLLSNLTILDLTDVRIMNFEHLNLPTTVNELFIGIPKSKSNPMFYQWISDIFHRDWIDEFNLDIDP
eukprot:gene5513-6867_t